MAVRTGPTFQPVRRTTPVVSPSRGMRPRSASTRAAIETP
jgi:hypothetical protein